MLFGKAEPLMDDDAFAKQSIVTSLKHMFAERHYNICAVDNCLKILGIKPPETEYRPLNALHCVHWGEMEPEFKQEVLIRTLRLFRHKALCLDKLDVITMFPESEKESKKVYKRLKAIEG